MTVGIVLVVGMDHDHDVRAELQGLGVAGLLVAAVAPVLFVDEDAEAELPGQLDGPVPAGVVDEDDLVHPLARDVVEGALQRLLGVVGRHDDDDFLRTFHGAFLIHVYHKTEPPGNARRSLCPGNHYNVTQ